MPLKSIPKILAFDTSSPRASLALLDGSNVLAELRLRTAQNHSTVLLSSIGFLLGRLGWTMDDLGLVAVGIGPGSFTGIRIGMATALGIAQSLSIPLAGISGLDALAHQVANLEGRLAVVLDAHRAQVFYAEYAGGKGKIRATRKPVLISLSDLEHYLADRHLYIVGDIEACRIRVSKPRQSGWPRPLDAELFLAPSIGRLALSRKKAWRSGEYLMSEPLYIRPPDALRNRARKRRE
jgi:tRNA threonylcarbamoyladenosine biosynthesis protein TsaB